MNYVVLKEMKDLELILEKGYYFKILGKETTMEKVKQLILEKGINVVALRDDKSLGYHSDCGQKYSEEGMKLIDVGDIDKSKLDIIKEVNKRELTFLSAGFVFGGLFGGLIINKFRG